MALFCNNLQNIRVDQFDRMTYLPFLSQNATPLPTCFLSFNGRVRVADLGLVSHLGRERRLVLMRTLNDQVANVFFVQPWQVVCGDLDMS